MDEKAARLPTEILEAATAVTRQAATRGNKQIKDRIVARLKRLHPMD